MGRITPLITGTMTSITDWSPYFVKFQIPFIRRLEMLRLHLLSAVGLTKSSEITPPEEVMPLTDPEKITFSSGRLRLHGFIHRPEGNYSFPTNFVESW
jgi:hypothetical protein